MSINLDYTLFTFIYVRIFIDLCFFFKASFVTFICQVFTVAIFCPLQSAYVALRNYFKAIFYKYNLKTKSKYFSSPVCV